MATITHHELYFSEFCKAPVPWRKTCVRKWFDKDNTFAYDATCAKDKIIEALFLLTGVDAKKGKAIINTITSRQYKKEGIKWVQHRLTQLVGDVGHGNDDGGFDGFDNHLFTIRMMNLINTIPRPSKATRGTKLMKHRLNVSKDDVGRLGVLAILPDDIKFEIASRL